MFVSAYCLLLAFFLTGSTCATFASANDDSFFWRVDSGNWVTENNRAGTGSWYLTDNTQVDSLSTGVHVLQIAYRENGTGLDKLVIQLDAATSKPTGVGPTESSKGVVREFCSAL